jgi:hypothetical protein
MTAFSLEPCTEGQYRIQAGTAVDVQGNPAASPPLAP